MAVNKVDVNGVTVLDLTQDSVTPATLKKGETAHDASGTPIVGTMESSAPSLQSKSVTYTANGTATIAPDEGYDGLSSVDVTVDVAGSGGGGVETCNVTLSEFVPYGGTVYYVDASQQQKTSKESFTAQKNSIIVCAFTTKVFEIVGTGDCTQIYAYNSRVFVYFINGDCSISVM